MVLEPGHLDVSGIPFPTSFVSPASTPVSWEVVVDHGRFDYSQHFPSAQPSEEMVLYTALRLAEKVYTPEEYGQLVTDLGEQSRRGAGVR